MQALENSSATVASFFKIETQRVHFPIFDALYLPNMPKSTLPSKVCILKKKSLHACIQRVQYSEGNLLLL